MELGELVGPRLDHICTHHCEGQPLSEFIDSWLNIEKKMQFEAVIRFGALCEPGKMIPESYQIRRFITAISISRRK